MKDYRQTRQGTNQLSEKTSDKLQVVKLNRSKIIIELMIFFLHGKRKGGEGENVTEKNIMSLKGTDDSRYAILLQYRTLNIFFRLKIFFTATKFTLSVCRKTTTIYIIG